MCVWVVAYKGDGRLETYIHFPVLVVRFCLFRPHRKLSRGIRQGCNNVPVCVCVFSVSTRWKPKPSERMISESSQFFSVYAKELNLTRHCWLNCLWLYWFIFSPHSSLCNPCPSLSSPLFTSHSFNKQLTTFTVSLSQSLSKHAAVGPSQAAPHHQSSHSTLTRTRGQMWDVGSVLGS